MSLDINPIAIQGPWSSGWTLDLHTLSSAFIGDDAFGHPQFENKRSEIGELLYQFKYSHQDTQQSMTTVFIGGSRDVSRFNDVICERL